MSASANQSYTGVTGRNEIFDAADPNLSFVVNAMDGYDYVVGYNGSDHLIGGWGLDVIKGLAGDDYIIGDSWLFDETSNGNPSLGAGADLILGGSGRDVIFAGGGSNFVDGGANEDVIYGWSGNELLQGGASNDVIFGGVGNDRIVGGTLSMSDQRLFIFDTFGTSFSVQFDGKTDLVSDTSFDPRDVVVPATLVGTGNDHLDGGAGNDIILGQDGNDTLLGGEGDDWLEGGAGADVLDGGAGFDFASYEASASGVFARLDIGLGSFGDALGDSYIDVDGLLGSGFSDILVGNAGTNQILGGGGADQLTGGAGADYLDGGSGFDFTRYDLAGSGVTVRLDLGLGLGGHAAGDTYVSIEGAVGSESNDALVGTSSGNYLFGLGGNDTLYGLGGFDEIYGGAGADTFAFRATDLPGGFATIRDYIAAEGDGLVFEGVAQGSLEIYQSGADAVIQLAGGSGGVVVANTTLAQLDGHLFFG